MGFSMILWTIQAIPAWEKLQKCGVLRLTNPDYLEETFLSAYRWMADQMKIRLRFKPSREMFPLWAWSQWEGEARRKPDLRSTGHLPKGNQGVRIEFEHPDDAVLLSDFELWHYALNYWYLPSSVADGEAFEAELAEQGLSFYESKPLPACAYHRRIQKSWERIFDLNWWEEDLVSPPAEKSIQGTFWELRLNQVKDAKFFTAR